MNAPRGILTAMVTPFTADGELDVPAGAALARHLIEHGSHGVVVAGTTGESPTLADTEVIELLRGVLDEIGGEATVVCGAGSNDTRHAVELTEGVCAAGAHAVLSVTPYYNKPNAAGLRAHFAAVSKAAGETPVVLYNIPSRSVINIGPELLAELAAEHENVTAVKQANNAEIGPIEGLEVIAGNDDIFVTCLERGGTGGILTGSHLAGERFREIYDTFNSGDLEAAREMQTGLMPLLDALGGAPLAASIKAGLVEQGVIESDAVRLPLVTLTQSERESVVSAMEATGAPASSRSAGM